MPAVGTIEEFCRQVREKSRSQSAFLDGEAETDELIYFSCLPWFDLTAMTNERNFDRDDAIPRIGWGKYVEREGGRSCTWRWK